ncbi:MAG TPA: DUF4157 domain-containing protein [Gemmataceae bacterium]|nr:DUF4157 domain-containing protein [Gemmataceae bacterium]
MSLRTDVSGARIPPANFGVVPLSEAELLHVTGGGDFSDVRVHVGGEAASAAGSLGAVAYGPGSLISLGSSLINYIAHELTH